MHWAERRDENDKPVKSGDGRTREHSTTRKTRPFGSEATRKLILWFVNSPIRVSIWYTCTFLDGEILNHLSSSSLIKYTCVLTLREKCDTPYVSISNRYRKYMYHYTMINILIHESNLKNLPRLIFLREFLRFTVPEWSRRSVQEFSINPQHYRWIENSSRILQLFLHLENFFENSSLIRQALKKIAKKFTTFLKRWQYATGVMNISDYSVTQLLRFRYSYTR